MIVVFVNAIYRTQARRENIAGCRGVSRGLIPSKSGIVNRYFLGFEPPLREERHGRRRCPPSRPSCRVRSFERSARPEQHNLLLI